jgi:uncharacterized protein with GYD domain
MAKYAIFFQFKPETLARMIDHPSDRESIVRRCMEAVGGRLEAYYWMNGEHDGFVIVEAADTLTAGAVSVAVGSTGAFTHLTTHELIPASDVNRLLERAKEARAAYTAPGAS